jgi:hypothetical protein
MYPTDKQRRIGQCVFVFRYCCGHGSSDTCGDACTAQLAGTAPNLDAASAPVWRSSRRSTSPRPRSAQLRAFEIAERTIARGRPNRGNALGAGDLGEMGIADFALGTRQATAKVPPERLQRQTIELL